MKAILKRVAFFFRVIPSFLLGFYGSENRNKQDKFIEVTFPYKLLKL